jgi:hypothetical protein
MGVQLVTSARYVEMLRNLVTPEVSRRGTELSTIWFQHDAANSHTLRAPMEVDREIFPEEVFFFLSNARRVFVASTSAGSLCQ